MQTTLSALHGPGTPLFAPGVYDGLSARIAEQAGFAAVYSSGGAIARSAGVPDLGLLSFSEVRDRTAQICAAVDIPVIADLDTGYGNALNVWRTVREFSQIGVGAVQLEDQVTPKKCGHYAGKEIVSTDEMVAKLAAADDARGAASFDIIARTDAIAVEGYNSAVARARAYRNAGADIIFVEAPQSIEQIRRVAIDLADIPMLINMFEGGQTPVAAPADLAALGYRIVIIPSDLQRAALRAMQTVAHELHSMGTSARLGEMLAGFDERDDLIGKHIWDARGTLRPRGRSAERRPHV